MATTNLKTLISRPGSKDAVKVAFTTLTSGNDVRIPRRLPFADILNLNDLKADGFLRGNNQDVSTEYGGANAAGALTNLGLTLPRTEKLILLAKLPAATDVTLTFTGNADYGFKNKTVLLKGDTIGDIYEIDIYDLGFRFENDAEGSVKISTSASVGLVLIARF